MDKLNEISNLQNVLLHLRKESYRNTLSLLNDYEFLNRVYKDYLNSHCIQNPPANLPFADQITIEHILQNLKNRYENLEKEDKKHKISIFKTDLVDIEAIIERIENLSNHWHTAEDVP